MTDGVAGVHHGRVDLDAFVRDGYVAIRGAVDAGTVAACRELIWDAMERRGVSRDDPATWPPLVEGMDDLSAGPFRAAYLAPPLTAAYDELIGPGRWQPRADMGESVVMRFPAEDERANAGYHIEGSYTAPPRLPGRSGPRMIAQPAVSAPAGFTLDGSDPSPVAQAVVKGLAMAD
jgi:hypothetical protein